MDNTPPGVEETESAAAARIPVELTRAGCVSFLSSKVGKQKANGPDKALAHPARRASLVHCCCLKWSAVFPILCGAHSITDA
jgi:hypothetical protein